MNIAVVAGGLSPERDVSLSSGSRIANALLDAGHNALLVDLYLGTGRTGGFAEQMAAQAGKRYEYQVAQSEPDLERLRLQSGNGRALIGPGVLELCREADVAFLALHGSIGENGQLQAVFDAYGVCYTGTGYAGSLMAMDKLWSKEMMRFHGIPTPDWIAADLEQESAEEIARRTEYPCVLKPCSCGSSVGVSVVNSREELAAAVEYARKYEHLILLEQLIRGREFSAGILDGKALPVIEIIPKEGFYDYKNKYQPGLTLEVCPAALTPEQTAQVQRLALQVHNTLRLGDYSRVDFMLDESGVFHCLEANTLPGMTPTSLLPQEAQAEGIGYQELCVKLVELAMRR